MNRPQTLGQAMARGRAAGLDHVRLVAALAVLISHAWPLALGRGMPEPLAGLLGSKLGGLAVLVFFFLSGVLISQSAHNAMKKNRKLLFVESRVRRIYPGLLVALVITVLIAIATGATPTVPEAVLYVVRALSLVSLEHNLTGAFSNNPYPDAVNGPLWTLFYEVLCYALIAGVIWLGRDRGVFRWAVVGMLAIFPLFITDLVNLPPSSIHHRLNVFAPLGYVSVVGAMAWRLRDRLPLRADLAVLLLCIAWGLLWRTRR